MQLMRAAYSRDITECECTRRGLKFKRFHPETRINNTNAPKRDKERMISFSANNCDNRSLIKVTEEGAAPQLVSFLRQYPVKYANLFVLSRFRDIILLLLLFLLL